MKKSNIINSNIVICNLQGYITAANVEKFQNKLNKEITSQNYGVFLVDMSEVGFLDSTGLITLIKAYKAVKKMGKHFVICSITAPVSIVFELVKLDGLIEIYQNYREFEETFRSAGILPTADFLFPVPSSLKIG